MHHSPGLADHRAVGVERDPPAADALGHLNLSATLASVSDGPGRRRGRSPMRWLPVGAAGAEELVAGVPVVEGADAVPLLKQRLRAWGAAGAVVGVEAAAGGAVDQNGVRGAGRRADP